jgi:hypothetical protein
VSLFGNTEGKQFGVRQDRANVQRVFLLRPYCRCEDLCGNGSTNVEACRPTDPNVLSGNLFENCQGVPHRLLLVFESALVDLRLWTPEAWEWDKVNMSDPVVQDAVQDLKVGLAPVSHSRMPTLPGQT